MNDNLGHTKKEKLFFCQIIIVHEAINVGSEILSALIYIFKLVNMVFAETMKKITLF